MSLVTVEELETILGITFNASQVVRAETILEMASAEVQSYCDAVSFERIQDDTLYLKGTWNNLLKVPKSPVHDVIAVFVDDEEFEDFDFTRHGLLISAERWGGPHATVTVVLDHGMEEVPFDVKSVVISRAIRTFVNPNSLMQQRMGADYSVSYSADVETITGLNRSERRTLARYRRSVA